MGGIEGYFLESSPLEEDPIFAVRECSGDAANPIAPLGALRWG